MNLNNKSTDWIPFPDGRYRVIKAYLTNMTDTQAVAIEEMVVEAYTDRRGQRRIKGHGAVFNHLLVELLEEGDDVNLWLDLGDEFKFRLKTPDIRSGKLFMPHVKSTFQFYPRQPWDVIGATDFETTVDAFELLTSR